MADDDTSDAKRAITVPSLLGVISPSTTAILPAVAADVALDAAGRSYDVKPVFVVIDVVVSEYCDQ